MSSRHMARLAAARAAENDEKHLDRVLDEEESNSDEEDIAHTATKATNFALLLSDDSESESEESEAESAGETREDDVEVNPNGEDETEVPRRRQDPSTESELRQEDSPLLDKTLEGLSGRSLESAANTASLNDGASKESQGRKKKKKGKKQADEGEKLSTSTSASSVADDIDSYLRFIEDDQEEVKANDADHEQQAGLQADGAESNVNGYGVCSSGALPALAALLKVDKRKLDPSGELKRLFGARTVEEIHGRNEREGVRHRGRRRQRAAPSHSSRRVRRSVLVDVGDDWPRPPMFVAGGIKMKTTLAPAHRTSKADENCVFFSYEASEEYKQTQRQFAICQETHDPNTLVQLLSKFPYQIEALMQLAEVCEHVGQNDRAVELRERCLFMFETAWAAQFDVETGLCRMSKQNDLDSAYFKILFERMISCGAKGCYSAAFAVGKALFSLDPSGDPQGSLLCLDFYALCAKEYEFVLGLCSSGLEIESVQGSQEELTEEAAREAEGRFESHVDPVVGVHLLPNLRLSLALALYRLGKVEEAEEKLSEALILYPRLLKPLLGKMGVANSGPWGEILGQTHFVGARELDEEVQHVLDIYVELNHILWKPNDIQELLQSAAWRASAQSGDKERLETLKKSVQHLKPALRKYLDVPLSEFSSEPRRLPLDNLFLGPNAMQQQQQREMEEQLRQLREVAAGAPAGTVLPADTNPLLLFFQSLMPWNSVEGVDNQQG